jgi:hypothetical protein
MRSRDNVIANLRKYGLKVFPCEGKKPDTNGTWKNVDENVPEGTNFGVTLGGINNIYVIDLDDERLIPYFQTLIDDTYSVKTGKGVHIYVQGGKLCPSNSSTESKYGHIDIKSNGGYVIGETSLHQSGKYYDLLSKTLDIKFIITSEITTLLEKVGVVYSKKESIKTRQTNAIVNGVSKGNRNNEYFAIACNLLKTMKDPKLAFDFISTMNEKNVEPLSKEEIDQLFQSATATVQKDIEESNTVHKIDDKTTYRLTDEEQKILRPITIDDENNKLILVYLNTNVEVAERKIETKPMAYFVVNGKYGKSLISYDSPELQKKYDSNIFKEFQSLVGRWKNVDIQTYLASDTKVSPKDIFDNLLNLEKQYFENPYDYDYFYEVCWKVHTYFYPLFTLTPYNDYTGMKNTGKSKRLKLTKFICYNAWSSDDSSTSSLFRTIGGTGATMLLDEVEKLGSTKTDNSDLQTILRGGFQNGHYVTKSEEVRGKWTPVAYDLFSPKAFGHINPLDNVLQDRCITTKLARTTNRTLANSEPEEVENSKIYQCRDGCYKLFLDYGIEVKSLIPEARGLFKDVSGRELNLWLPLVTIALFFEKHGVVGLVDKLMAKLDVNSEEKKTKDAEQNDEVKILSVLLQTVPDKIPKKSRDLYALINRGLEELYNLEPVNSVKLFNYLENLGFANRRSSTGTNWINVNEVKLKEAQERCGMIKATQATLAYSDNSVGSAS